MHLFSLLIAAIFPLALLANPLVEPDALTEPELVFDSLADLEAYERRDAQLEVDFLETRGFSRPQTCGITGGSATVNCRANPRTSSRVVRSLRKGSTWNFWCVKSGQCVTIKGKRNCGWHLNRDLNCFVNGHYTDNRCTRARLGGCGDADDNSASKPFN